MENLDSLNFLQKVSNLRFRNIRRVFPGAARRRVLPWQKFICFIYQSSEIHNWTESLLSILFIARIAPMLTCRRT